MNKKRLLKMTLSVLLSAIMLVPAAFLTGCSSSDTSAAVLELDSQKITENMYHFWASRFKGQYIYQYDDVQNTDECWQKELLEDGTTTAEYFDALTLENIKYTIVAMKLFDEYGLSVSSSEKQGIDANIDDVIKEYAEGSKNMMNTVLSEYGINLKMLREIYIDDLMSSKVYDYLYGENGTEKITDDDKEAYYEKNYVHFQMIFINNAYQYKTDSEGNYATGDDGYYIQEELDSDIMAQKNETIKNIQAQLDQGADFDELFNKYSEFTSYSNGYYFSKNDTSLGERIYYDVINAADGMDEGEIQTVAGDYGTCIVKKLALDRGGWNDSQNSDFFKTSDSDFEDTVGDELFRKKLGEYFDEIIVDEDAIKSYSVAEITPSYMF